MKISIIAARSENNVIGYKQEIPWRAPSDLAYFKDKTLGHYIIMGRKTFDSLPIKPLPNRTNIVISGNVKYEAPEDVIVKSNIKDAFKIAEMAGETEVFVIGGQQIYTLAIPFAHKIYMTEISCRVNGDAFFPEFDGQEWQEIKSESFLADKENEYDYTFKVLKRRKD